MTTEEDKIKTVILKGLEIDLEFVFRELKSVDFLGNDPDLFSL